MRGIRAGVLAGVVFLAACHGGKAPGPEQLDEAKNPEIGQAAAALADQAAQSCPFPADAAKYEQTNFAARSRQTPAPALGILRPVRSGCAVLTFTVDESGLVQHATVLNADSPAFAAIAPKMLRWQNFAHGADTTTVFMVRLGAQMQTDGRGLLTFAFRDWTVNLIIPA